MKRILIIVSTVIDVVLVIFVSLAVAQDSRPQHQSGLQGALSAAFTYQGQLRTSNRGVEGLCDFQFGLWDAAEGGNPLGAAQLIDDVSLAGGLFTVSLDFGADVFDGEARWLATAVRCDGDVDFVPLTPRQALTAAPYALSLRPGAAIRSSNAPAALTLSNHIPAGGIGLDVDTATSHGVRVGSADENGVDIADAGKDGVYVGSADESGLYVDVADTGVSVNAAAGDGFFVCMAGAVSPPCFRTAENNGVEVFRAEHNGVLVTMAGGDGVDATSTNPLAYGGRFENAAAGGTGLYARGGSGAAPDVVLGGDGDSDDGKIFSDPQYASSDIWLVSNDSVRLRLDNDDDDEDADFDIVVDNNTNVIFDVDDSGEVYADGSYNTPAADFAEMLPAVAGLEAGDVLIIGPDGKLARSREAYQPTVAGVYSARPGFVGGKADDTESTGQVPLTVVGVVWVKASAENGPIQPGDALAASSTPGHAMRAETLTFNGISFYPSGVILGKALGTLESGTGVIQMLVTAQ